jgi:hypothetical protein
VRQGFGIFLLGLAQLSSRGHGVARVLSLQIELRRFKMWIRAKMTL